MGNSLFDYVSSCLDEFQTKEEVKISIEKWRAYDKKDIQSIIIEALRECPYDWISDWIDEDLESGDLKITFTDNLVTIYEKDYSDTIDE